LIVLAAALCLALPAGAQAPRDMEDVIRAKELERLQREYKKNQTVEDELYQYEKAGRMPDQDYPRDLEYVKARQDIMPLTFGDRYFSEVFWVGPSMQRSTRDQSPDWLKSEKYLEMRRQGKELERVGPAEDAPGDEVRATYGFRYGSGYNAVTFNGYEKFDTRTQTWYPVKGQKNYATGKMEYDYIPEVRALMMETIRRDTVARLGPEKYKQLMEHARQRTPEYKVEKYMDKVRAQAKVYDPQQHRFVAQAGAGQQAGAKPEATSGSRQSDKDRQKEMERKAEAQQKREAEQKPPQPDSDAGKGIPVIPETCVIDIVFWDPDKPGKKNTGFVCLRGGSYRLEAVQKCSGYTKDQVYIHPSEFRMNLQGQLRDNVITGTETFGHTKPNRSDGSTGTTPCSWYSVSEGKGSSTTTFHLGGRLEMSSSWSGVNRSWTDTPKCGSGGESTYSRSQKYVGTWSIRKPNTGSTVKVEQYGRCTIRSYCP
jgi:hypothetical protein